MNQKAVVLSFVLVLSSFLPSSAVLAKSSKWPVKAPEAQAGKLKSPLTDNQILGNWNAHIFVIERRPLVIIETCTSSDLSGTYIGPMGKFPLRGKVDRNTGEVQLNVDFSASLFSRMRPKNNPVAVLDGKLDGVKIAGTARFPDVQDKQFKWEATRATGE